MVFVLPIKIAGNTMRNDSSIVEKIENYIKKSIHDPIIAKRECPIPNLSYFSAFAKENLAEDPIIESGRS